MNKKSAIILIMLLFHQIVFAAQQVKIETVKGDVKIRRGVEENWQTAELGILLEEIDTIQTGEKSEVILEIDSGQIFTLKSNALLDISDLRKVSEKEMQLFLMSKKIGKIKHRKQKRPLRVGNVSVVHGLKAEDTKTAEKMFDKNLWRKETNGAKALFDFLYYTNAVVKLNKILSKYSFENDCGEIHYYLGRSLKQLCPKIIFLLPEHEY